MIRFRRFTPEFSIVNNDIVAHCNPMPNGSYLKAADVYAILDPLIEALEDYCNKVEQDQNDPIIIYNIVNNILKKPDHTRKKQCLNCRSILPISDFYKSGGINKRADCKACYNKKHIT